MSFTQIFRQERRHLNALTSRLDIDLITMSCCNETNSLNKDLETSCLDGHVMDNKIQ